MVVTMCALNICVRWMKMSDKTHFLTIHSSFRSAIECKYNLLLKALLEDKRIVIKWNDKKKELKIYIEEVKAI